MLSENNSHTKWQKLIWCKLVCFLSLRFCKNKVEMELIRDTMLSRNKTKQKKRIKSKIALWSSTKQYYNCIHMWTYLEPTWTFPKEAELQCSLLKAQRAGSGWSLFLGISHFNSSPTYYYICFKLWNHSFYLPSAF